MTSASFTSPPGSLLIVRLGAMGDVIHAIRVAVTGKSTGPGLFDCLAILGRDRCLARIDRAVAEAKGAASA